MENFTLALLIFACVVTVILLVLLSIAIITLRNLLKTLKTVNSAKCRSAEDHFQILAKLQGWNPIMQKMEQMTGMMSPILKRKVDYSKNTVNTNKDDTQLAVLPSGED